MDNRVEETEACEMDFALKRSLISRNKLAIVMKTSGGTEYCCVQCPAKYNEKEKLELHLCVHNKEYRFLCGICGTGLKRKEHLDRHTLEHTEVRPHECLDCGKRFKRKEHLNIHRSIHKGAKNQVCTLCNRSFNRKDHLQKHIQTHSKLFSEENSYGVDEDEELMDMKQEREVEIKEDYMDIKVEIIDEEIKPLDPNGSYNDYELSEQYEHGVTIADEYSRPEPTVDVRTPDSHTNQRPFVCPVCYKSYKRKDHLKIHSWTHMRKDKECSGCGKAFHTDAQLATHMLCCAHVPRDEDDSSLEADGIHHLDALVADNTLLVERQRRMDPESRPHQCLVCHRRFKRKQHLKVHSNVHLRQEASIWCSLCNAGFLSNTQFEQHECKSSVRLAGEEMAYEGGPDLQVREAGPREGIKENNYPAELLIQEMVEESSELLGSLPADEQNIPVPQRVFVCRFCQKPFKRRDHYKIHLHIHTGVKDFFCPDCGKGFYRKDHLQKHSQTHAKQKPKPKKQLPDLFPISLVGKTPEVKSDVKPEITITAPSNSKLRVPLQMKVPYQMVVASAGGRRRAVTVAPPQPPRPAA